MIVYVKQNLMKFIKARSNNFSKTTEHKINIKTWLYFTYSKEQTEIEIKNIYNASKNKMENFWQERTPLQWKLQTALRIIKGDLYNLKTFTLLIGPKVSTIKDWNM